LTFGAFRRTNGVVKRHLLFNCKGYLAVFVYITEGNVHEVNIAKDLYFPKGFIVVVGQGYTDYAHYTG
jgi:hypothetical protein